MTSAFTKSAFSFPVYGIASNVATYKYGATAGCRPSRKAIVSNFQLKCISSLYSQRMPNSIVFSRSLSNGCPILYPSKCFRRNRDFHNSSQLSALHDFQVCSTKHSYSYLSEISAYPLVLRGEKFQFNNPTFLTTSRQEGSFSQPFFNPSCKALTHKVNPVSYCPVLYRAPVSRWFFFSVTSPFKYQQQFNRTYCMTPLNRNRNMLSGTSYISGTCYQARHNSNFIKQVMNQVKKELETNQDLRKSVKEFQDSRMMERSSNMKQQIHDISHKIWEYTLFVYNKSSDMIAHANEYILTTKKVFYQFKENSHFLQITINATSTTYNVIKQGAMYVLDLTTNLLDKIKDEKAETAKSRAEKWRLEMEKKRAEQEQSSMDEKEINETMINSKLKSSPSDRTASDEQTYALVIAQDSAWDRFGTKLRDMPFLQNFFENPMLGKLFGESEQAAALREMRVLDPTFRLPDLVDLTEHVIAPHLLHSFLNGNREALRMQCREAAFAAADQSIKEREVLKLSLDPSVLLLRNVEFKGAAIIPDSGPWFIFTFTAQQINCMRDQMGQVVAGAIDDIREVTYSVALKKHPEPEKEGLEYPWQVTEFAIICNTPCW